ncbi:MAG: hypothetical protein A2V64_04215 [Bacteroidetes bacterium RBG_13_43_22]|nr:MAG: hypothetical protein A2V64_04215 [Bacteroidetes bacterium RBG_13_43_22]
MVLNHYPPDFRRLSFAGVFLLLITVQCAQAQRVGSEPPPLKERLFYGGSFGLQIGTITDIEISPIIGLWVLPRLNVAAGPNYRFYKDPAGRTDIYGGKGYTEFVLIKDINSIVPLGINMGIFFHFEDEFLSLDSEFWNISTATSERYNINTLLAGAGLSQPIGRRSSLNMMVLWALNESEYNIYSTPEFRVSFTF